jgi:cystathionine beta-lyase family protein involved in aluminum resistance
LSVESEKVEVIIPKIIKPINPSVFVWVENLFNNYLTIIPPTTLEADLTIKR